MHIFIDESGSFSGPDGEHSVSAVGSLVMPDQQMRGFERLYGRLRPRLPKSSGEVKGRLLSEEQVGEVVEILSKLNCLLEIVAVDSATHTRAEITEHKSGQEAAITRHITDAHPPTLLRQVRGLREQLERTKLPLYVQSVAMTHLVYQTLNHANAYYAFRLPRELGDYHWVIDAKGRDSNTPWEDWWSKTVLPMIETKSFEEPMIAIKGGDYRWLDKLRTEPSEFKKQHINEPETGDYFSLNPVLQKDFRFSSSPEFGLEAVDILVNAVRRSMAGNFRRVGWLPIRRLMINRRGHYIDLITLSHRGVKPDDIPYAAVLRDFTSGGKHMLPPNYGAGSTKCR